MIVIFIFWREFPCESIFSGNQSLYLADKLYNTLGTVFAENQLQFAYQIPFCVQIATYSNFNSRVSFFHQEQQCQVCGTAIFRCKCKGHFFAVLICLCRFARNFTIVQFHAIRQRRTGCNLDRNFTYYIGIFHIIPQVNLVHVLTVNAFDWRGRGGNLNQSRNHGF